MKHFLALFYWTIKDTVRVLTEERVYAFIESKANQFILPRRKHTQKYTKRILGHKRYRIPMNKFSELEERTHANHISKNWERVDGYFHIWISIRSFNRYSKK